MKSIFTLVLLLSAGVLNAQANLNFVTGYAFAKDYIHYLNFNGDREHIKENKIASQTARFIYKGKELKTVSKYDTEGYILSRMGYDDKGNLNSVYNYEYDTDHRLVKTHGQYKGHSSIVIRYYYNSEDVLVGTSVYDEKKGHCGGHKEIYGSGGQLVSQMVFEKDSVTPHKRLDYAYYEDGSKESIKYYIGNKLKYTWSFECKESGELVEEKTQDSTRVCIKEEHDTYGNRVVWKQEFNSKGEPLKTRFVYSPDATLLTRTEFNAEEKMRSHTAYLPDGGYLQTSYDKTGTVYNTREQVCNSDGLVVKSSYIYKKDYGIYLYAYQDGRLTTEVHTYNNAFGDHGSFTEYSYTFY